MRLARTDSSETFAWVLAMMRSSYNLSVKCVLVALSLLTSMPALPAMAVQLKPLSQCGSERWNTKTLNDPNARDVNQTAKATTIAALVGLPVPSGYSANNDATRYAPTEDTVYTVRALLVGFMEEDDRDLHVVIADPSLTDIAMADLKLKKGKKPPANIMIAEIPDPQCYSVRSGTSADEIGRVRSSFEQCFGPPSGSLQRFTGHMIVDISGVGFFDKLHGQNGLAVNGIEIHPVLRIKTISGTCPTGYSASNFSAGAM